MRRPAGRRRAVWSNGGWFCRLSARFEDDPGAASLRLSADDTHWNAEGHRLAAEEIHAWLEAHPWALERKLPPSPGP